MNDLKNQLTTHQAKALIDRADLVLNEANQAKNLARQALIQAEESFRQAAEMRALIRQIIPHLLGETL